MNKHRFFWRGNENIGHKLHLNVALNNVKKVSEYLIRNRILHKYLSEEKLMTGKFLLYMAAQKKNTDKIAKQISDDLKNELCKPLCQWRSGICTECCR